MNKISSVKDLQFLAKDIRINIIRMLAEAESGHIGGSLGLVDIFTSLYFHILNHEPRNPNWEERDRLILSIGHVTPVLYATLAKAGYFPEEELMTLRKLNSRLQGHPAKEHGLPGIELSAGSLGQGLSVSTGIALAGKTDKKLWNVFCILGDGELQEGSVWEAAMSASYYKLNNLIAIIDRNNCQIDGRTSSVMEIEPLNEKWKAFGWDVLECNGHSFTDIIKTIEAAKQSVFRPSVIIAKTTMGRGVKSIEDNYLWHGKVPSKTEAENFILELNQ